MLQAALVATAMAFGAAALFLGAHSLLVAGFFMIGAGSLYLLFRSLEAERRPPVEPVDTATPAAARIETLADRMWELHEREEHFHGLIDALGDLVIHRDRDGRIVYANRVFADLVGRPQAELIGLRLAESEHRGRPCPRRRLC